MKTNSMFLAAGVAALFAAAAPSAQAISVSFQFLPGAQNVGLGGSAFVGIYSTEAGGPGALGSFFVDMTFDSSIISFVGATGGTGFGTSTGLLVDATGAGLGLLNLSEASFDTPATLVGGQPDMFLLATLEFSADALGTSPLGFSLVDASDENGFSIQAGGGTGSITVVESGNPGGGTGVPDGGSTALLLALPAIGFFWKSRHQKA